jgi:hypothetical protein
MTALNRGYYAATTLATVGFYLTITLVVAPFFI